MSAYFFDITEGDRCFSDNEGSDLPNRAAARQEAIGVLSDIARDKLPDGNHREFTVTLRDDTRASIFFASLTLSARWLDGKD